MAVKDTLDKEKKNKLLEILSTDYKTENILLALIAIVAAAFSVMILNGSLEVKDSYPILGSYPKVFAIILLCIAVLGLIVVIWPFYQPALGEFKKLTWATPHELYEDIFRVLVFMAFLIFILFFYDVICRELYALIYR